MRRPGGLDRADAETDDSRPDRIPEGVTVGRYAAEPRNLAEPPEGGGSRLFGTGRIKVHTAVWEGHLHGWSCRRCGASAVSRAFQVAHERDHAERDRVLVQLETDYEQMSGALRELAGRNLELEGELAAERGRVDALLLAIGHPDDEALERAVARILGVWAGKEAAGGRM
jgi:hypothetical protein